MIDPVEFDCSECGRHIISLGAPPNEFKLCATCLIIPGWQYVPEIAKVIDPDREFQAQTNISLHLRGRILKTRKPSPRRPSV